MLSTPFPSSLDKLALAVQSAVEVKEQTVKEYGIGEDININLYGWKGAYLHAILQMSSSLMAKPHEERFGRVADAACVVRRATGIDSITMIAEGYISTDPTKTADMPLSEAFVKKGSVVKECLTFTHIYDEQVLFMTKPYIYNVPRKLIWEDEIFTPGQTVMRGGNAKYPMMLSKILRQEAVEEAPLDEETYLETIAIGLRNIGFETSWF